jgi:hypothetical protein
VQAIGRVFTPLEWACWLIKLSGAFERWRNGGTVFDPTCGDGAFLEAFMHLGKESNSLDQHSVTRIFGNELIADDKAAFLARVENKYKVRFREANFTTMDFFKRRVSMTFDCVVGNPPWSNFTDLGDVLKDELKLAFSQYGLVLNKKDVLLGGSRADIATLVVQKAVLENLVAGGIAAFWLPKSIFFNEAANKNFRAFRVGPDQYQCEKVYLFDEARKAVFPSVATSYCAAVFRKGAKQSYPVPAYQYLNGDKWTQCFVSPPTDDSLGGWKEHSDTEKARNTHKLVLQVNQKPRQGINTCGANDVFIFERAEDVGPHDRRLTNRSGETVTLPKALTFPLVTRHTFRGRVEPDRWIFVPYDSATGRPLNTLQLTQYQSARIYLERHRETLASRKGVLIRSQISKGLFWSMLGVGPYSFAPWKIVWESYGKKEFKPIKVRGEWQGNQAMHAFIPCENLDDADRVLSSLAKMDVESELLRHGMGGTTNWAQPGRIARMFEFSGSLI